jgi:hypothetical protein
VELPPFVKKHGALILAGAAGLVALYFFWPSAAQGSTGTASDPNLAAELAASNTANLNNAQIAQASQNESDAAANAAATLAAQRANADAQNSIAALSAAGTAISGIISAQDTIPIAAIDTAGATNQAALMSAAAVAASANNAVPGALAASYAPLEQFGKAVANSGSVLAVNSFAQGSNTSAAAAASVATSAEQAAASRAQSSGNSTTQIIGTVGTIAAIALL